VIAYLKNNNIYFDQNISLSDVTYLKTGGIAKIIAYPGDIKKMSGLIAFLSRVGTMFKVIGATSNLLFLDNTDYTFLVCTSSLKSIEYNEVNEEIMADAGMMLPDLSRFALYNSIFGFAGLEGIPGTLGGAVFMNAGAYGYEIKDTLVAVDIASYEGEVHRYSCAELELGHRNSALRKNEIEGTILRCYFTANKGDAEEISNEMEFYHAKRHKYQDFLYPNLGSIFSSSPYRALGEKDKLFRYVSAVYLILFYKIKIFRRESPINRKWLNDLVVKRFGINYEIKPFSNKTINCLVNRGQGTEEMVRFIEEMKDLTDNSISLENEIVNGF